MFEENDDWDDIDLNSSLAEALLEKPVATPTQGRKSRNKYRPDAANVKKRPKTNAAHPITVTPVESETPTPLGKRKKPSKSNKGPKTKQPRQKHSGCNVIFDDMSNWEGVIADHEAEDEDAENLAQYFNTVASEILKENQSDNTEAEVQPKKKKKKGEKKKTQDLNEPSEDESEMASEATTTSSLQSAKNKISNLKTKLQKKMDASQFRYINEKLYTTTGDEAMELFKSKPELFEVYHRGFSNQAEKWEVNPVDRIIDYIRSCGSSQGVADFGCGDAKIARTLTTHAVFSFDLVQHNSHVVVANSSKVPLGDKSVDISVFCLSLMGTDFKDFIREGRRVLKSKGRLVIAEVMSRIPDKAEFIHGIEEIGFSLLQQSEPNNYFLELIFKKTKPKENKAKFEKLSLKPCSYKKR